jgi:hypothetical protein
MVKDTVAGGRKRDLGSNRLTAAKSASPLLDRSLSANGLIGPL